MTHLSQLDCCTLLGIDPKTLRQWMRQAQQQVQQLATQHARPLPLPQDFPTPCLHQQARPP